MLMTMSILHKRDKEKLSWEFYWGRFYCMFALFIVHADLPRGLGILASATFIQSHLIYVVNLSVQSPSILSSTSHQRLPRGVNTMTSSSDSSGIVNSALVGGLVNRLSSSESATNHNFASLTASFLIPLS